MRRRWAMPPMMENSLSTVSHAEIVENAERRLFFKTVFKSICTKYEKGFIVIASDESIVD
jgi:hypothetical protein